MQLKEGKLQQIHSGCVTGLCHFRLFSRSEFCAVLQVPIVSETFLKKTKKQKKQKKNKTKSRERERERQTDRQTETETETDTDRQRERQRE